MARHAAPWPPRSRVPPGLNGGVHKWRGTRRPGHLGPWGQWTPSGGQAHGALATSPLEANWVLGGGPSGGQCIMWPGIRRPFLHRPSLHRPKVNSTPSMFAVWFLKQFSSEAPQLIFYVRRRVTAEVERGCESSYICVTTRFNQHPLLIYTLTVGSVGFPSHLKARLFPSS